MSEIDINPDRFRRYKEFIYHFGVSRALKKGFWRVFRELNITLTEIKDRTEARRHGEMSLEALLAPGVSRSAPGEAFRASLHQKFFFNGTQKSFLTENINNLSPKSGRLIIARADDVCNHEFDLLGSGPTSLGDRIKWHLDFKSNHYWHPERYYKRINPAKYPGGYDIKVPWELSRCQHFVWLGQAYWITENERYGEEFVNQILDWIESNPWPLGVNWACTMDVAIRAINWLWGLAYFLDFPGLTDEILNKILFRLWRHGQHILYNLEVLPDLTTNHYLANLVGLIYLGILLPVENEASYWRNFGLSELEKEIFKQVYTDGVSFEASTSYHRLSTELFLSGTILAQKNGHQFSQSYMTRLEKMLEFTRYITRPDGSVPLIGDQDNGRVHRLSFWEEPHREWIDFRYLLAIGSVIFSRNDFLLAAEDQWQEAIWILGDQAVEFRERRRYQGKSRLTHELKSRAFPIGGIYVLRRDDWHIAIDCGSVGLNGLGSHAHNDSLSIELYADGINWLVDPGSYIYTANYVARNQFRSTAFHNTVVIDGKEQNRINPNLFVLDEVYPPEVHTWITENQFDFISATHKGYLDLKKPVSHNRQVFFKKEPLRYLLIQDNFTGMGNHIFSWYFQTGSDQIDTRKNSILLCKNGQGMVIFFDQVYPEINILTGWRSQCYGHKDRIQTIQCTLSHSVPYQVKYLFQLVNPDSDWFHETEIIANNVFDKTPHIYIHSQKKIDI